MKERPVQINRGLLLLECSIATNLLRLFGLFSGYCLVAITSKIQIKVLEMNCEQTKCNINRVYV